MADEKVDIEKTPVPTSIPLIPEVEESLGVNVNEQVITKNEKNDESTNSVPFYKLFSFADSADWFLMVFGAIGAAGNGICMPLMTVIFGEVIDSFGGSLNTEDVASKIAKVLTTTMVVLGFSLQYLHVKYFIMFVVLTI